MKIKKFNENNNVWRFDVEDALETAYENANIIEVKKVREYDYANASNYSLKNIK